MLEELVQGANRLGISANRLVPVYEGIIHNPDDYEAATAFGWKQLGIRAKIAKASRVIVLSHECLPYPPGSPEWVALEPLGVEFLALEDAFPPMGLPSVKAGNPGATKPDSCVVCRAPMHFGHRPIPPGLKRHVANGLCERCDRRKRRGKAPVSPQPL